MGLVRKHGKLLLWGTAIYFAWLLILLMWEGSLFPNSTTLNALFGDRSKPSSFLTSWAASTLDNFLFFILIGVALGILSFKNPEKDPVPTKISYLFPKTKKGSALAHSLQYEISALACVNTHQDREINIEEISQCGGYFKILTKSHSVIRNIYNNHKIANVELLFGMEVTDLEGKVEALGEVLGEIRDFNILSLEDGTMKKEPILKGTVSLGTHRLNCKLPHSVSLEPETEIICQTSGWFWQDKNHPSYYRTTRFTESTKFAFINHTDRDIKVIVTYLNIKKDREINVFLRRGKAKSKCIEKVISPNQEYVFEKSESLPKDIVRVDFKSDWDEPESFITKIKKAVTQI